jgi:outer membrane lipoprotein-sorting protein
MVRLCAALLVALGVPGCLSHTRTLQKVQRATNLKTATLEELVQSVDKRDEAIQALSLTVDIAVSVGGVQKGTVTDYTSFTGYILLKKPDELRVLGLLPVVHTKAFDMASNGKQFTLLIPPKNKAIEGSDMGVNRSGSALESLRPHIFADSLLVRTVNPNDFIYLAGETKYDSDPKSKMLIEKVDYDVGVLHRKDDTNQLLPRRIIHINRKDLLPYEQDIYDDAGVIETQATYSNYQEDDGVQFPHLIKILRPQEEYEITLTVEKITLNQQLNEDQFALTVPEGIAIKKLD